MRTRSAVRRAFTDFAEVRPDTYVLKLTRSQMARRPAGALDRTRAAVRDMFSSSGRSWSDAGRWPCCAHSGTSRIHLRGLPQMQSCGSPDLRLAAFAGLRNHAGPTMDPHFRSC